MRNPMNTRLRRDNSTGFKGVTRKKNGGFLARVQAQVGKGAKRQVFTVWSGHYGTPEDAARGYDDAVRDLHGSEGSRFNFPRVGETGLDGVRRSA